MSFIEERLLGTSTWTPSSSSPTYLASDDPSLTNATSEFETMALLVKPYVTIAVASRQTEHEEDIYQSAIKISAVTTRCMY